MADMKAWSHGVRKANLMLTFLRIYTQAYMPTNVPAT